MPSLKKKCLLSLICSTHHKQLLVMCSSWRDIVGHFKCKLSFCFFFFCFFFILFFFLLSILYLSSSPSSAACSLIFLSLSPFFLPVPFVRLHSFLLLSFSPFSLYDFIPSLMLLCFIRPFSLSIHSSDFPSQLHSPLSLSLLNVYLALFS